MTDTMNLAFRAPGSRLVFVLASLACLAAPGVSQTTERVSVDSAGVEGNSFSECSSVSADGRFVAFQSWASNLVPGDHNSGVDIFVRDRQTGRTTRVSVDSAGAQASGWSWSPSISADGRFVAFASDAVDLVPGDTNGVRDVFVHDRQTGKTARVSVDSAGGEGNDESEGPSISADGRFVAFASDAVDLVPGDTNGVRDVFVHDRQTGQTSRVSLDSTGVEGNVYSLGASISADGRMVAFESYANNLVPGDTNLTVDVFVRDRQMGHTNRVSLDSAGVQGDGPSGGASISADGRLVAFTSWANNLVPGDTNGAADVFVHDRQTSQTTRLSVGSLGVEGDDYSGGPSMSAAGRLVAFQSRASNLISGDTNGDTDVFVHDRQAGQTKRVSVDSAGMEANGLSEGAAFAADGCFVAFASHAPNLVPGDTNGFQDVFVHDTTGGIPQLAVRNLVAGGAATIQVTSATAGGMVRHGYSLAGGGPIHTSYGLLLLSPPFRELPPMTANASGIATVAAPVPPGTTGIPVWVHAFDVGSLTFTNGVATAIG